MIRRWIGEDVTGLGRVQTGVDLDQILHFCLVDLTVHSDQTLMILDLIREEGNHLKDIPTFAIQLNFTKVLEGMIRHILGIFSLRPGIEVHHHHENV